MFSEKYQAMWDQERRKKKRFTHRYDIIPAKVLIPPILEVGAGEGQRQVECRHKDIFLAGDYVGLDLLQPENPQLKIIQCDFMMFATKKKFRTVLMSSVLEHISLEDWPFVIEKLKHFCAKDGHVIIFVPYNESMDLYQHYEGDHLVYGITKRFMGYFFPDSEIKMIWDEKIRQHGEGLIWALGRWVKRLVTLDKKIFKIIPRRIGILVIWKNDPHRAV